MATATLNPTGWAYYNSGWVPSNGYNTDWSEGGYAGGTSVPRKFVLEFKVPPLTGTNSNRSLHFNLPCIATDITSTTLSYQVTDAGRADGLSGSDNVQGNTKLSGSFEVSGLNAGVTFKMLNTDGATLPAGTYYLWLYGGSVISIGCATPVITMDYTAVTACSAPTTVTASPSIFYGSVTVEWSGARAGVGQSIVGYQIQRRIKSSDIWGDWLTLKTVNTSKSDGNYTFNPTYSNGTYVQFRVMTLGSVGASYYSGYKSSNTIRQDTPPTPPTKFTSDKYLILQGDTIALSWSGATDVDNNIAKYVIEKSTNNGETWLVSTTVTTNSTGGKVSLKPSNVAGTEMIYRIKTVDALNVESGYKYCTKIVIDSAPNAPSSMLSSSTKYNQGDVLTLTWQSSSDKENNVVGYELRYRVSSSTVWSNWISLTTIGKATSCKVTPTQAPDGGKIQYSIRAKDSLGLVSAYTYSPEIFRDDYTGIHVDDKKAYPYICVDGETFTRCEMLYCLDGQDFFKGVD